MRFAILPWYVSLRPSVWGPRQFDLEAPVGIDCKRSNRQALRRRQQERTATSSLIVNDSKIGRASPKWNNEKRNRMEQNRAERLLRTVVC